MEDIKQCARNLLQTWRGECYSFGNGVIEQLPQAILPYGKRVLVVASAHHSLDLVENLLHSMRHLGLTIAEGRPIFGAKPNSPREDIFRIETHILHQKPDCVLAIGGGSTIDACKAAIVLAAYGDTCSAELEYYFGAGLVSKAAAETGRKLLPLIAVQTAASSGAHLTKYANVTDVVSGQKKLIVDPAITPVCAFFDYRMSQSMPLGATLAGVLDGTAHVFESFCSAKPEQYDLLQRIALCALRLIFEYAPRILTDPSDADAREALGLATDLGGYAIMVGATSGAHLTSFSLVDLTAHGTACGIMSPYYAVFYAPAIQPQLKAVGTLLHQYGYLERPAEALSGRALAEAVANGFLAFNRSIHAPTKLTELKGFSEAYVTRMISAAKDPSLSVKLQSMPVPMTAEEVDTYMLPIIRAAMDGDLSQIINKQ